MKKRKSWVNAVNRTDWSPQEIFSNFIMFGAFVDGWHSVSDDPVFSHNEKYITDWISSSNLGTGFTRECIRLRENFAQCRATQQSSTDYLQVKLYTGGSWSSCCQDAP